VAINTSALKNKFAVELVISFHQELHIHHPVLVLSHFMALYIVQGIFIKNIPIVEYNNILFDFDSCSSLLHIDIIIKAPAYTIIISNIHENIYFAVLKTLNHTF
jgi:hypothetical protein